MKQLRETLAARVRKLMSRTYWGKDALPHMTLGQAHVLMNALADMHAIGFLRGQMLERRRSASYRQEGCSAQ